MVSIVVFYWLVCGFATWQKSSYTTGNNFLDLSISVIFGGFVIPARLINKILK
jgi:hypothetical protein